MRQVFYPRILILAGLWIFGFFVFPLELWAGGAYPYRFPDPKLPLDPQANTVIDLLGEYTIKEKDTLNVESNTVSIKLYTL